MVRVNLILQHPDWQDCLKRNREWEQERPFCHHDLTHLLEVARVGYIMALETKGKKKFLEGLGHEFFLGKRMKQAQALQYIKEIIYAAALLHDMGKWKQYESGEDHAQAGAAMCRPVLTDCGFREGEIDIIAEAILNHRKKGRNMAKDFLGRILARADLHSRSCFNCAAKNDCRFPERKEAGLTY